MVNPIENENNILDYKCQQFDQVVNPLPQLENSGEEPG